jgi:hypothetical protein
MRAYKPCVVLALVAGISVGTYAQGTQPILKLPNDIEFKEQPPISENHTVTCVPTSTTRSVGIWK